MKNSLELIQFGKEISDSYVRDNIPLTKSLEKLAEMQGLNKQEMYRVAETANIETYLKLINKSEDKYIEFPLADVNEAYGTITTKTASSQEDDIDEYQDLKPRLEFSFNLYDKNILENEKVATDSVNIHEIINQADRLNGTIEYVGNTYLEEAVNLAKEYDKIYDFVKQAVLSNEVNFNDITELIKVASPINYTYLSQVLKEDLKKVMPVYDFEKKASFENMPVNKNSALYQSILNYDTKLTLLEKIAQTFQEYETAFDTLNTEYKLGLIKKASSLLTKLKVGGIAGAALVLGGGFGAGKLIKNQAKAGNLTKTVAMEAMANAKKRL